MKKDVARLETFLATLDKSAPAALEFRHESWFDDEVYDCLRAHGRAFCIADDEKLTCPTVSTARWGYVRLRREKYAKKDLRKWIKALLSQRWNKCYVFFKHEETGTGPKSAAEFLELADTK